jgi:hypothetical protein
MHQAVGYKKGHLFQRIGFFGWRCMGHSCRAYMSAIPVCVGKYCRLQVFSNHDTVELAIPHHVESCRGWPSTAFGEALEPKGESLL